MNTIARYASKALNVKKCGAVVRGFVKPVLMQEQYSQGLCRSLWVLSKGTHHSHSFLKGEVSKTCGCGCSTAGSLHTKGDKELTEFLEEEINAEVKSQKHPEPPKIKGFDIKTDGADVTLTKKFNNETITITLNVNDSVDTEMPNETEASNKEGDFGEMKSKPDFTVEIVKGGKGLCLECCFAGEEAAPQDDQQDGYNDIFQITELSLFEGEMKDSTYAVSGEIMDGYLYDLLMNMLEDRGISNEFAENLMEFCTAYEHQQYVSLLKGLKSFVSGN